MKTKINNLFRSIFISAEQRRAELLFDEVWYKQVYGQKLKRGERPIVHWLTTGLEEGFSPHPLFSINHYINGEPLREGENPLLHFLEHSGRDGRSPHPLFDAPWYLRTNTDVAESGQNPLLHYLRYGAIEGRRPCASFDSRWYLTEYQDVADAGINPLIHYVLYGEKEGRFKNESEKLVIRNSLFDNKADSSTIKARCKLSGYVVDEIDAEFISKMHETGKATQGYLDLPISKDIRVISFDVWDTLLRRVCHPDEVKLMSARYLYINHYWKLQPAYRNLPALLKARQQAENRVSLTTDYEYRFSDASLNWLAEVFTRGTPEAVIKKIANDLIEHEFAAELRSTQCDVLATNFLKQAGLPPVIFASDFYMPTEFLHKLLMQNRVPDIFVKGYSSSELVKNKRSGLLFSHILEEFDAKPHEILHVGDNRQADVSIPESMGIRTYHYVSEHDEKLKAWFGSAFSERMRNVTNLHEQRILTLLEHFAGKLTPQKKDAGAVALFRLGIRLAPIAVGFILHIIEQAKRFDVDKVFFFTREGLFLRKLFDSVIDANPYLTTYPSSEVLEVSRLATFSPSLESIDAENLMRVWSLYSKQSAQALCRTLNLDCEEARSIFERANIDYEEVITYPWKNKAFMGVITGKEFHKFAQPKISLQKDLLQKYFESKGFVKHDGAEVVVDLGWRGTIQDNLAHLFPQHLHGCYLGLYRFLNRQMVNTSKTGWLFDNNQPGHAWSELEVAPLEMLFNGPGGSVSHYELNEKNEVIAKKVVDEIEDEVYHKYTSWMQQGMLAAVPALVEYIAVHALTSDDLRTSSRHIVDSLLDKPTPEFIKAFFTLSHNEVFGTGEYYESDGFVDQFIAGYKKNDGAGLHAFTEEFLKSVRWPMGFLMLDQIREVVKAGGDFKAASLPYQYFRVLEQLDREVSPRIGIFVPAPLVGSGGHRTIYNMARKFVKAGCEVFCFLESEGQGMQVALDYLGGERVHLSVGWPNYLELDMAIATIAHSASFVAGLKKATHKAYLVQDYEAYFNPVGDAYTIAENSYTYGLLHFTIGNWLSHVLPTQYGGRAIPAGLGIDTAVYNVDKNIKREKAICFLYQPEKPRRNPTLGIDALYRVKQKHPDTKIYVYGSDAPIHLDFEVENLGLIKDLSKINELYNKCEIGLCISMSNPSRIPFEMMAAGCVPVDVYRYNNLFDYEPSTIKMAYQTPDSLAEAICELLENKTELRKRRTKSIRFASARTLEWETDVIVNSAVAYLQGKHPEQSNVQMLYTEPPVIAEKDKSPSVIAFCDWQLNLSNA